MTDPIRTALAEQQEEGPSHGDICQWLERQGYWARGRLGSSSQIASMVQDALARWGNPAPQPPAEGEVAELVDSLLSEAGCEEVEHRCATITAPELRRTAELLQQQHPTPVPVSDEPWKREGWCDENGWCWFGYHGEVWMFCHPNEREISSVSLPAGALPVPLAQGEVE